MPILGTTFYNDLLTKYNNQTLDPDEETLVTFIQPIIAWRAAEDAVFGLSLQLKNKGLQTQFGDNSSSVDRGTIAFSMEHYADCVIIEVKVLTEQIRDSFSNTYSKGIRLAYKFDYIFLFFQFQ